MTLPLTLPPVPFWSLSDCNVEKWCQDLHLNHAALLMADAIHTQLTDTLKRIEMPISAPAFSSSSNTLNIKKALLAGFFMQVRRLNSGQQKNTTQLFFQTPRFFMVTFRSQLVHSNAARHNTVLYYTVILGFFSINYFILIKNELLNTNAFMFIYTLSHHVKIHCFWFLITIPTLNNIN